MKLTKSQARKAYDAGQTVYIIAHKLAPFTMYAFEYPATKPEPIPEPAWDGDARASFDSVVQSYTFYNCTYETGYYPAYYVKKGE
jgi:hypothetical protein